MNADRCALQRPRQPARPEGTPSATMPARRSNAAYGTTAHGETACSATTPGITACSTPARGTAGVAPVRHVRSSAVSEAAGCVTAFQRAIAEAGLGCPDVIADGSLHRFALPGDRRGEKTGWYCLFTDGVPAGAFGSWREGEPRRWSARRADTLTAAERDELQRRMERARRLREAAREAEAGAAARAAAGLWAAAGAADVAHPYLRARQVGVFGLRQAGGALLVPMRDVQGRLRGLQRIFADGTKRFVRGTAKTGLFHRIGGDGDTVYVCEGYATGASLHMATGCTVIVAFDAGNLEPVARAVRETLPAGTLVVAADNDRQTRRPDGTLWNTGLEHARKAAAAAGARLVWPEFANPNAPGSDFNDLHRLEGLHAVRRQAAGPVCGPCLDDWDVGAFAGQARPQRWLVDQTLPLGVPCLLAAAGGTGKGLLLLDLGLSVAGGLPSARPARPDLPDGRQDFCEPAQPAPERPQWLGHPVMARGTAVILAAEDSREAIHQRLCALDPDGSRRAAAAGRLAVVPLPSAGGPVTLAVAQTHGAFGVTPAFADLRRQLRQIADLRLLVIDPLACFVGLDINKDPQAGQYVQGLLASLAEETGATVLAAHHMAKTGRDGRMNADTAREAIRGTTALVDGARCAVAIWPADDAKDARRALRSGIETFEAAVVKSNAPADRTVRVLQRQPSGLLVAVARAGQPGRTPRPEPGKLLAAAIAAAAKAGRPYTKSGQTGLYARREELPDDLRALARNKLEALLQDAVDAHLVTACSAGRSATRWLDAPDGPFASGTGTFEPDWQRAMIHKGGRPRSNAP